MRRYRRFLQVWRAAAFRRQAEIGIVLLALCVSGATGEGVWWVMTHGHVPIVRSQVARPLAGSFFDRRVDRADRASCLEAVEPAGAPASAVQLETTCRSEVEASAG